jgi:hypothetical protein
VQFQEKKQILREKKNSNNRAVVKADFCSEGNLSFLLRTKVPPQLSLVIIIGLIAIAI